MTLDYKILGQLYYGPEINETPEIPGTSGYYTYTTGSVEHKFIIADFNYENIRYSSDGVTWKSMSLPEGPTAASGQVVFGDNGKVLIKSDNAIFYSKDFGLTWNSSSITAQSVAQLVYGNNKFFAISSNMVEYSEDGSSWTVATPELNAVSPSRVIYEQNKFVMLDYPSDTIYYSLDGLSWATTTLPAGITEPQSIAYGDGKFVVIGISSSNPYTSAFAYSQDGVSWTQSNELVPEEYLGYSILYGSGKFLSFNSSNQIAYSTDAINWTVQSSVFPISKAWGYGSYGNGLFILAASNHNGIVYSEDGINWQESFTGIFAGNIGYGTLNTLTEVQISIGGQGTPGSYVEIIEPQVVYTVPSGKETTITSIFITNHDSVERTFDLAVVPAGEELSLKHHIRWDMPVSATDFDLSNAKITMSAGDKIYVFPSTINKVGFTLFGVEKS